MTNYQYRGNTYRKKRVVKRRRINKVRFSIFILICLLLILSLFFGIKALLTDKVPVQFAITNDLNEEVGASSFNLTMSWEALDVEQYKDIVIKVNDEVYQLDSSQTTFEVELEQPETAYHIEFKAKKKGLAFSNTLKKTITTQKDNQRFTQSIENFLMDDNGLTFDHVLNQQELKSLNLKSLSYQLISSKEEVLESFIPKEMNKEGDTLRIKVEIPIVSLEEYHALSLVFSGEQSGVIFTSTVQDEDAKTTLNHSTQSALTPTFEGKDLILINEQLEHYDYVEHNFYAESLHVKVNTPAETIETYQLVNHEGVEVVNEKYESETNKGIQLANLEAGRYYLYFNNEPIYTHDKVFDEWYTIQRDGIAKHIEVKTYQGMLAIDVKDVTELPEDVYDILIDPGHGGLDTGTAFNNLLEAEEVLKIANYITSRLEDHGLKVKMTRTEDLDPAGKGNFDYNESPYYEEGRVEQAYQYQPKYMISNHLNSYDKSLEGFEVYTPVSATNEWGELVASALTAAGQGPRDSEKSEFRVSEGSYKKYYLCKDSDYVTTYGCQNDYMDYLYIIRETGGKATQASTLLKYNDNYKAIPNYGPETMLIEYAYIDNVKDSNEWKANYEKWGEAVVKATLQYLNVPYKSK